MDLSTDIAQLQQKQDLPPQQMTAALRTIFSPNCADSSIRTFLVALHDKGETADEIFSAASFLREQSIRIEPTRPYLVDCCGTGGDQKNTFNISTAVAFVLAGAGCNVAKHGNRAVSSHCGSADVLEALGVQVRLSPDSCRKCIDEIGIGFLFAPDFHPILARVATVRKSIPHRTIFNLLGPLLNPAEVRRQLVGVYEARLAPVLTRVLEKLGSESAIVVAAENGMDEVSLTCNTNVSRLYDGCMTSEIFDPRSSGYTLCTESDLAGGNPQESATRLIQVLKGHSLPLDHAVHLNAAFGLMAAGKVTNFMDGLLTAQESIASGRAYQKLRDLIHLTQHLVGHPA